jgi:hypothetical protein
LSTQDSRLLPHPQGYPDFVEAKISILVSQWGNSREAVLKEYHREFDASAERSLTQFRGSSPEKVLEIRQNFAIGRAFQMLVQRPPSTIFTIIYLGHGGKKLGKGDNKPYINAFVALKEGGNLIIRRMVGKGKYAEYPLALIPLTAYSANLGRFGEAGDLIMDDRTTFNPIQPTGLDAYSLCSELKIPIVTIEEAKQNPSKKASDGYVIATDWRCIMGYVSGSPRVNASKDAPKDSDIKYGVMTITDSTVQEKPYMDNQGRTVFPGITGWVAPEFCIFEEGSYCAFFGTIDKTKDANTQIEKLSMSVGLVIPIFQSTGLEVR